MVNDEEDDEEDDDVVENTSSDDDDGGSHSPLGVGFGDYEVGPPAKRPKPGTSIEGAKALLWVLPLRFEITEPFDAKEKGSLAADEDPQVQARDRALDEEAMDTHLDCGFLQWSTEFEVAL